MRFFATHPVPTIPSSGDPPVVTKVCFVTVLEHSAATGERYGRPDAALLCYVELRADFAVHGPPLPGTQPVAASVDGVSVVFDAATGNLLSVGSTHRLP